VDEGEANQPAEASGNSTMAAGELFCEDIYIPGTYSPVNP